MRRRFLNNIKSVSTEYFTIEALEDGLTASLSINDCEYSIDNGNWNTLSANSNTLSINKGQTLSFRGNLTPDSSTADSSNGIGTFTISKKCNLKGNIMSLLFGEGFEGQINLTGKDCAFCKLFYNCNTIVDTSKLILPATILSRNCYRSMFLDCTSLIYPPELPSTKLKGYCYYAMFKGCTSLKIAPELPATVIPIFEQMCYGYMFNGCTSLTTAPELPATSIIHWCYFGMFLNCTSLTTAPSVLPATSLYSQCYAYMFKGCTSLKIAPELPAKSLVQLCYQEMFNGCSKLNYIKMLATDISTKDDPLDSWVSGVASTGTFVKDPDMTTLPKGSDGIPYGWTVEDYIIITFTLHIDGKNVEYQAEEGMTWGDWVDSEYNTCGAYIMSNDKINIYRHAFDHIYNSTTNEYDGVYKTDIIQNNHRYVGYGGPGGN